MNKLFVILGLSLSVAALADDIRRIDLSASDSNSFTKAIAYLTTVTSVPDKQNSAVWYMVRNFKSKNEALILDCSTKVMAGTSTTSTCHLDFNLTKSTPDLEVFEGKLFGALVAQINTESVASNLNEGMGSIPFISLEKVEVKLSNGGVQLSPRLRIDCEKTPGSNIRKSCKMVAVPDQAS